VSRHVVTVVLLWLALTAVGLALVLVTGKEVRIPPGRTIRFKPGKELQNIGGQPE
jgi:hypothetical protein